MSANKIHRYSVAVQWTGNRGTGTSNYTEYGREYNIVLPNGNIIEASSDVAFRGDKNKINPEEMLLSSISSCHMLWYLHFCADNGIVVLEYTDNPSGTMVQDETGSGKFTQIVLRPTMVLKDENLREKALQLHHTAHKFCFIANSVNFEIVIEAV